MTTTKKLVRYLGVGVIAALLLASIGPLVPMLIARADGGPTVSVTAPTTVPGAPAAISGSGFTPGETVHINFGTHSTDVSADSGGNITGVSMSIPTVPAGLQFVSAFGVTSGKWGLGYLWVAGYAPAVSPSTYYVLPGQTLSFTGSGFAPNESIQLVYNSAVLGSTTTNGGGGFSLSGVTLPMSLHNTTATVTVTGATSNMPTPLTLTVGQLYPSINPSAWYTAPGSIISISGNGFAPNEVVNITAGTKAASSTASASGAFTLGSFTLPATSGGSVNIIATGATSGAVASASITLSTLSPWLTFSTYWAQGGAALTIFGNGFAGGESVALTSGTQTLGTATAASNGAFTFAGAVPFAPAGPVTITGTGATSGASGGGTMQVAPVYTSLTLGSYAVTRGTALSIIGSGYLPNEPVQVTTSNTGSTVVLTITANSSGNFDNSSYIIPASTTPGNMTVTAFGTHSFDTKSVTLYVGI
jgi:hypothetical protein